jgi:SAM-dependent methyltransferase
MLPLNEHHTLVTPKYDYDRFVCLGEHDGPVTGDRQRVKLFMINRALDVWLAGSITTKPGVRPSMCNFVLDGEFDASSKTLHIFDVLSYKHKNLLDCRTFPDRFKFAPAIVFGVQLSSCIRLAVKPMYAFTDLEALSRTRSTSVATDGFIFIDTQLLRSQPVKWKPVEQITNDFILANNRDLYVSNGSGRNLIFIDEVDLPRIVGAVPRIVECRYDTSKPPINPGHDLDLSPGQWTVARIRMDKSSPNHMSVFERNIELIRNGFRLDTVIANVAPRPPGFDTDRTDRTDVPKTYYSSSAASRTTSLAAAMRNFHNRTVKEQSFRKYYGGSIRVVMDIGCGRGGDVFRHCKYATSNVKSIFFVDNDAGALQEAQVRWNKATSRFKHAVDARWVKADMNSSEDAYSLAATIANVDLAISHFSAHYYLERLPQFLSDTLSDGGLFVCTLFDGERVRTLLGTEPRNKKEWQMQGRTVTSLAMSAADPDTVDVFIDTIGHVIPEPLHNLVRFRQSMEAAGFTCLESRPFGTIDSHDGTFAPDHPLRSFSNLYTLMVFEKKKTLMPWESGFSF